MESGNGYCGCILVVDHDDATRRTVGRVAARLGHEMREIESGELLLDDDNFDLERPALAIVEVELPGSLSGLDVLQELHERYGDGFPVILVSAERATAIDRTAGLMLGADDYLTKPLDAGELCARVRRSLRRIGNENGSGRANGGGKHVGLSPREQEILELLAGGRTQTEIAATLVISTKTVSTHIQHLLAKLGVHSRAQAVAAAYRLGLVEADVRAHVLAEEPIVLAPVPVAVD